MRATRGGFTLLEVTVTLALLGLLFGLIGVSMVTLESPPQAAVSRELAAARRVAVRTGVPVTLAFASDTVTLYPDGSATGARVRDSVGAWRIDPWTGATTHD